MSSIDCQPSIHWEFPESSAERKEKGMVVLYPSLDYKGDLLRERLQAFIQKLQKTYQVVLGALSNGAGLDIQEGRRLLRDRGVERVSATLFFHGVFSTMIYLEQGKHYRREDVRAEHFEGLDALYFVACQTGMETDGLAGRAVQSLAGRIAQVAKIVVWAPMSEMDVEKAVFYTGPGYHGPAFFDAEGKNIYRIFCPSGIWVSPSSLSVSQVVDEMRRRALESIYEDRPDLMATRFLTAHYWDNQEFEEAKLWASRTLDRFTMKADESGYCQYIVGCVFEEHSKQLDRAYPYYERAALYGHRGAQLRMAEILVERKEYQGAARYFDMLGRIPRYSNFGPIRAKYVRALHTLSHNTSLASGYFYDCIVQICSLKEKKVSEEKLFPILFESVKSLRELSQEGDPMASHYLTHLLFDNGPLRNWGQRLGLFQTDLDRLNVLEQYLQLYRTQIRKPQQKCCILS